MMGVDVPAAVSKMVSLGADAVGFNCGTASLEEYVELAKLTERARFVSGVALEARAGCPRHSQVFAEPTPASPNVDGQAVYRVTPEEFAAACARIRQAGVPILGGCCGTSPEHIRAVAEALKA
jgi:5-methyltetrahydrofolate--homocysteine methyltransferase